MAKRGPNFKRFILNCGKSPSTDTDWTFGDAAEAEYVDTSSTVPPAVDLRADWWQIRDQGKSGACVGFAAADGVLRWHYVKKDWIDKTDLPSPRFIWMANKETDDITNYPTSFLDRAGTSTKLALRVAQRYGCVLENMLPMDGRLSRLQPNVFFSIAAQFRIIAYYNLDRELGKWKAWIANNGPVLTRLDVDETWKGATRTNGILAEYNKVNEYGGHAVCLVGYTEDSFIVRNSWGTAWGNNGFAYASDEYAAEAFTEAYGTVI